MPKKFNEINKNQKKFRIKWLAFALLAVFPVFSRAEAYERVTPVVKAVEKVSPAVVNISSRQEIRRRINPFSGLSADPFFDRFFRDFFDQKTPNRYSRSSLGSGVVIDGGRGFILTNAHVIENAGAITVSLLDEREFEASVVGSDPDSDLAVLKIASPNPLPAVSMGRSEDLMIGETIIAIGNPFGFSHTVTTGVISAVNRSIRTENRVFHDFIQIDASINPGNSGGPLLNINGELIGINTAIYAQAQGIGFAIPIQKARRIVSDLIAYGEVIPAWFGVTVHDLNERMASYLGVPKHQGVVIQWVMPSGPADAAGVLQGDVLMEMGGRPVESASDYRRRLRDYAEKTSVPWTLWRKNGRLVIPVMAGTFPISRAPELGFDLLGIKVADIDASFRRRYRILADAGAAITEVDPSSYLGHIGVAPGDVVRKIDDLSVKTASDFEKAVIKCRLKPSVVVLVQRQDQGYYITVKLGELR